MALIRKLFWLSLFVVTSFAFTVLFEHGTENYFENARKEFDYLSQMVGSAKPERKGDESHKFY